MIPTAELIEADIHDDRDLDRLLLDIDAVINLVGVLQGDFHDAHVEPGVAGDLLVVPEHARAFLYAEHHDMVWVHTPGTTETDRFVAHMERSGFPLSDERPDETFKPVTWMS